MLKLILTLCLFHVCMVFSHVPNVGRGTKKDMHYTADNEHNKTYDQVKFLGERAAKDFESMSKSEAKKALMKIIKNMDANGDGFITKAEMKSRLQRVQDEYINRTTLEMWNSQNKANDNFVTWEEIENTTYAYLSAPSADKADAEVLEFGRKQLKRDQRRFKVADENHDGKLDWNEYVHFAHPETSEKMKEVILSETIADMDKNGDGFINLKEYIDDMWKNEGEEPDWVKRERTNFKLYRDKNNDGKLDREEVRQIYYPDGYDEFEAEALHLLREADSDNDGKLSIDEIIDHSDLFVGSNLVHKENIHEEL